MKSWIRYDFHVFECFTFTKNKIINVELFFVFSNRLKMNRDIDEFERKRESLSQPLDVPVEDDKAVDDVDAEGSVEKDENEEGDQA